MTLNVENLKAWGLNVWYPFTNNSFSPIVGKSLTPYNRNPTLHINKDGRTSVSFTKNSLLYCATDPIFDAGSNYTVFLWVKCNTFTNTFHLLGKWASNVADRWAIGIGNSGDYLGHPVMSVETTIHITDVNVTLNIWHCIAMSCSNDYGTFYYDGIALESATLPHLQANSHLFQIGGFTNFSEYKIYSDAHLRNCMLFDQALSPAQIKALYEATYIE